MSSPELSILWRYKHGCLPLVQPLETLVSFLWNKEVAVAGCVLPARGGYMHRWEYMPYIPADFNELVDLPWHTHQSPQQLPLQKSFENVIFFHKLLMTSLWWLRIFHCIFRMISSLLPCLSLLLTGGLLRADWSMIPISSSVQCWTVALQIWALRSWCRSLMDWFAGSKAPR